MTSFWIWAAIRSSAVAVICELRPRADAAATVRDLYESQRLPPPSWRESARVPSGSANRASRRVTPRRACRARRAGTASLRADRSPPSLARRGRVGRCWPRRSRASGWRPAWSC